MPSLAHYMTQYDHEHESGWNKFLHGVGIPMIFAGIIFLLFTKWILGAGFFSRMGASLSRPPDRGKPSGVFSRTDLFASWANLGCKGSMDVPNGHAPQADLGGTPQSDAMK